MERSTLHNLLETLAASPQPPTTVDISRAASEGRRTVRLRRLAAAGSAALVTAAIAIVTSVVASGTVAVGPEPQPADSSISVSPPVEPPPGEAPKAFDPLVQYADFGWLPEGLTYRLTHSDPTRLSINVHQSGAIPCSAADPAVPAGCGVDYSPGMVALTVVPAGRTIQPAVASFSAAEPVNGRPARWADDAESGLSLQWEYAPGAWAEVGLWSVEYAGDARYVARRIAETVRFGIDQRIKLPVQPTGLPATIRIMAVSVSREFAAGSSGWSIELQYSNTGERTSLGDWPLSILAYLSSAREGDGNLVGDPTTTLDGYPARRINHRDGGKGLQVFDVDGVFIEMSTHSSAMTQQLGGGLDGLFRGLEINRDPSNWR